MTKTNQNLSLDIDQKLFWDVEYGPNTKVTNPEFVIERVLQRGEVGDFKAILNYYSKAELVAVIKKSRRIPRRVAIFLAIFYKISPQNLCSITQSPNPLWKF